MKSARRVKGFTLIELLVVIGILAVLLAITLIAINPARQFSQANNTKRSSDVNAILNAVGQYAADNQGNLTALGITATASAIADTGVAICDDLVPQYIAALPVDPLTNNGTSITNCAAAYTTGYTISQSATDNRITVNAPDAELSEVISVTR
ncbi:MAG: type II secretion system protein [Candidatus Levybacteria bacterium]|nr:type II secretion system protein [Candidatus Levybacteria bacterium]